VPKQKPTSTISHRIEFQTKEREAIEMVALSITAKNATQSVANLTKGAGNLLTPVLSASAAGVAAALGLIAWWELRDLEKEKNATFDAALGDGWISKVLAPLTGDFRDTEGYQRLKQEPTPEQVAKKQKEHRDYRASLSQFRNAISTSLMNFANKF
jgi:hypothetical protein